MVEQCPEDMKEKVAEFKELLKQEAKLHVRTDDNFILRHLRAAAGDVTVAFDKLKTYYQLKKEYPEWYASKPPEAYRSILSFGSDYILEDRDTSGKTIWVHKTRNIDSSQTTLPQFSQMHDLILETVLDEPQTQKEGMICLIDMKDVPWSLVRWLSTHNLRIATKKADSLTFPKLEYHVVNTSMFFSFLIKIVYPFLSTKQKENLFIHGDNRESLHEKIDPSVLPEEYGGKKPNKSEDDLHSVIFNYSEQLTVNLNMGYRD